MIKKPFTTKEKLEEIAAKYPTPFHIYDEAGIRKSAEALKQAFSWNTVAAVTALQKPS